MISPFMHDSLSIEEQSRIRYLSHLYVPKEHRRKGEATKLLNKITSEADEARATLVAEVGAYDDGDLTGEALAGLYVKHGFIKIQDSPLLMMRSPAPLNLSPKPTRLIITDLYS